MGARAHGRAFFVTADARERLAVLVHEVRSPVAALGAIAEASRAQMETGARRTLVDLALAACRAIERVVTDAAVASVRLEPTDLAEVVAESVHAAALAGTQVSAIVEPGLPAIEVDRLRLRQALDNLIANAATHAGGKIVVRAASSDAAIALTVSDSGPGIPPEEHDHVFEAGVRLDATRPGSGLGLAIVRAIADAHGASVTLESEPGLGATFGLVFPVG